MLKMSLNSPECCAGVVSGMSRMLIWYMFNDTPKCRSVGSEKSGKREKWEARKVKTKKHYAQRGSKVSECGKREK
ncbi:MAG: hypothetical protein WC721_10895 [Victivallaceae bacterium]